MRMSNSQLIRTVALYTVFGAGAVLALFATVQSFAVPSVPPTPSAPLAAAAPVQPSAPSLPTATDGSVTVQVTAVERSGSLTTVTLAMDNHQFDLGSLDARTRSSFNGVAPADYRVLQSASGGHHVQSQLVFNGVLSGGLTVGLGNELTFRFTIP